ncbi:MAG: hypothetical protein LBG72_02285 [Spirochaetaceae bacterium]|jgi:hypothetical protein|nr:hypothetical protein [Spirochaetaceae bacterium]
MKLKNRVDCYDRILIPAVFLLLIISFNAEGQVQKPYQIPSEVTVGDTGKLVYPLDEFFLNIQKGAALWENDGGDIEILNVEYDRSGKALIISFRSWRAGMLTLPAITLGGETLSGLQVYVVSVLAKNDAALVLLPQEGPLNPPGTFWLLVLASTLFILGILAVLFAVVYGKSAYRVIAENARIRMPRRRIIRRIKKFKRRLQKGKIDSGIFLSLVCFEFRDFIDRVHAIDCAALTAGEFRLLNIEGHERIAGLLENADSLRFSGKTIQEDSALCFTQRLLNEVEIQCAPAEAG